MGRWCVGKTYAWKHSVREAGDVALITRPYAYVSMFGINSLDDLKQAIYESTVSPNNAGAPPTWDTVAAISGNAKSGLRKMRSSLGAVSSVITVAGVNLGTVGDLIVRSAFLLVRDQTICLDDLERAGEALKARDVLRLISYLTRSAIAAWPCV